MLFCWSYFSCYTRNVHDKKNQMTTNPSIVVAFHQKDPQKILDIIEKDDCIQSLCCINPKRAVLLEIINHVHPYLLMKVNNERASPNAGICFHLISIGSGTGLFEYLLEYLWKQKLLEQKDSISQDISLRVTGVDVAQVNQFLDKSQFHWVDPRKEMNFESFISIMITLSSSCTNFLCAVDKLMESKQNPGNPFQSSNKNQQHITKIVLGVYLKPISCILPYLQHIFTATKKHPIIVLLGPLTENPLENNQFKQYLHDMEYTVSLKLTGPPLKHWEFLTMLRNRKDL